MNLIKNVTGSWETARQLVRQDLDTIQRTINQILGQINAPVADTPVPPATISAANTVTTYGSDPLTSVAVKPNGLLSGNGMITHPLDATLSLSATGALSGAGTSASPLAVAVDATTIDIVANQLHAIIPTSGLPILTVTGLIGAIAAAALNSGPLTIITGVAGKIIIPIVSTLRVSFTNPSENFTGSLSAGLRYVGYTSDIMTLGQVCTTVTINKVSYTMNTGALANIVGNPFVGASIQIRTPSDVGYALISPYVPSYSCIYEVAYILIDSA